MQEDFEDLLEKLKTERDELKLKMHLASMDAMDEFEKAEKQWTHVKAEAADIADQTKETSVEYIAKTKIVVEELKDTYHRIAKRLSEDSSKA